MEAENENEPQVVNQPYVAVNVPVDQDRLDTLLAGALRMQNVEMARELLELGANAGLPNPTGSWEEVYCFRQNVEMVEVLLDHDHDARPGHTWESRLHQLLSLACRTGCGDMVRLLLRRKATVNGVNPYYRATPLCLACTAGAHACVRVLLEHGADVNETSAPLSSLTPLRRAVDTGSWRCVELLVQYGANVNQEDATGVDPLGAVALRALDTDSSRRCVRALVKGGASVTTVHVEDMQFADMWQTYVLLLRVRNSPQGSMDWSPSVAGLYDRPTRAAVEGALRALLLADARRAGCELAWDAVERVLQAAAS
jgi:ankyrin repeat protein